MALILPSSLLLRSSRKLALLIILLPLACPVSCAPSNAPNKTTPVFVEYIGASGNPMKFEVPINEGVDFHYILAFAIDASPNGTYNNGIFVEYWDSNLTPNAVFDLKEKHKNVKVMMSLCGWSIYDDNTGKDQPLFWYEPKDRQQWLDNAVSSITGLLQRYHLDGIDIDYENFHYPNNFSSIMGELVTRLKEEGVGIVSIAPFKWVIEPYLELFENFNESIDYVNYQFYADRVPNAQLYLATYNNLTRIFGYKKLLPSYEIEGRGVQGQAWWDSIALIQAQNSIVGLMIWSADESVPLHYYYEIQSQALLANATSS